MPQVAGECTCVIAGGGPAGMMLGLLLARAGVDVTVMEKHPDFLHDFRGDTVHASTLRLLDELGLTKQFADLPHRFIEGFSIEVQGVPIDVDFRRIPGVHKQIALVPQWDFLEMLATAAEAEPSFRLLRSTEVIGPLRQGNRVIGVSYRNRAGDHQRMRAALTVACDGRSSTLRSTMGLVPQSFSGAMDVWLFRLPRRPDDPPGIVGVLKPGRATVMIDRGDYYQIEYIIPKGSDAELRAQSMEAFHHSLRSMVPWMADRIGALTSFDEVKLLDVRMDRLRRWFSDGVLFIGDAAHAMSPVAGVGVNLAIADAVAAARILAGPLRTGRVPTRRLAQLQMRRWIPAATLQALQRRIQADLVGDMVTVAADGVSKGPSRSVRLMGRTPALRRLAGYLVAIGPLPEHAPSYAGRY